MDTMAVKEMIKALTGLTVETLTPEKRAEIQLPDKGPDGEITGVVITRVERNSPAWDVKLQEKKNRVITFVNNVVPVPTVEDFWAALDEARKDGGARLSVMEPERGIRVWYFCNYLRFE